MQPAEISVFQQTVLGYYRRSGRHDLPWRLPDAAGFDPYRIMVSELMLQQTQVARVVPKYGAFLETFPTVADLAAAPLGAVLAAWNGLGYNRRAKFLWQSATMILNDYDAHFPKTLDELTRLPGIGSNTAGAIMAYAFDLPVVFIETNIRTVYIHHFCGETVTVSDARIRELVAMSLPAGSPRQWYWALMDYGSYLKQTTGNAARRSATYSRQPAFVGSKRQLRGHVLKLLIGRSYRTSELQHQLADDRLSGVIVSLRQEGLITQLGDRLSI